MPVTFQQPYNMFRSPGLKKPVGVYDPKKSVQENLEGKGTPSPQNIVNAYGTPKAQSDLSQPMKHGNTQSQPVLDGGSSTAGMDYLNSLYTDPREEERLRKASVMNQRIMAIGDAVRHIGNIASTINYAPSQQLNSPVLEEQARYERGKALRDRANQQYYTYQQQKAAQDAAMKRYEDTSDLKLQQLQFQQDKFNRQQNLNEFKAKTDKWYKEATLEQKEAALEIQRQLAEGRISLMEANRALAEVKTRQGGFAPKSGGSGGRGGGSRGGMSDYDVTETRTKKENPDGTITWTSQKSRRGSTGSQSISTTKTTAQQKKPTGVKWGGGLSQSKKNTKKATGVKWQ